MIWVILFHKLFFHNLYILLYQLTAYLLFIHLAYSLSKIFTQHIIPISLFETFSLKDFK